MELKERQQIATPENTAVRVALWRALRVQVDPPLFLRGRRGLKLGDPDRGLAKPSRHEPLYAALLRFHFCSCLFHRRSPFIIEGILSWEFQARIQKTQNA